MGGRRKKVVLGTMETEEYNVELSTEEEAELEEAEKERAEAAEKIIETYADDQEPFREEVKADLEDLVTKANRKAEDVAKEVQEFVENKITGNLRHKECYCVMSGKDNIVMAFLPDAFDGKNRGKIFQIIGECGLSMENATTLSASELFDRQVKPEEKPDPQKPLFKEESEE